MRDKGRHIKIVAYTIFNDVPDFKTRRTMIHVMRDDKRNVNIIAVSVFVAIPWIVFTVDLYHTIIHG